MNCAVDIGLAKALAFSQDEVVSAPSTTIKEKEMMEKRKVKFLKSNMGRRLMAALFVAISLFTTSHVVFAQDETPLKFKSGIGVIPVTGVAATGAVNLNIVRGVSPGAPWRIAALQAAIFPDGHIRVDGRGLLLASGNGIGTNAGQKVHATLFCGPAATATEHDSTLTGVALAADGDFKINDYLSPLPPLSCDTPVLLIRNAGGVWFAAGIQKVEP
jgi:hypothetical protein